MNWKKPIGQRESYHGQVNERAEMKKRLAEAIHQGRPYGIGRAGVSEQIVLYYPILLRSNPSQTQLRAFEYQVREHGFTHSGIFPQDNEFYLQYAASYLDSIRRLDLFGMILDQHMGPAIIQHNQIKTPLIFHKDLVPDRSIPADESNCYLSLFRGKRILLICPFAKALAERANRATFEQTWSKTGKRWFFPAAVEAFEHAYGFDQKTQQRFGNSLNMLDELYAQLDQRSFDIALVASGGISVPLVAHLRDRGKIAISLGGALQVLFGVIGKRWRSRQEWCEKYVNPHWIDTPAAYKPQGDFFAQGAYW